MSNKTYIFFSVVIMALLCVYTYFAILALGFEESISSTNSIIVLAIVLISGTTVLLSRNNMKSDFFRFWVVWIIWMIFIIVLLRLNSPSKSAIWSALFSPMVFSFCYSARQVTYKTNTIFTIGFLVVFGLASYMNIKNLDMLMVDIGEESGISNLVFWCLCSVPFFFLVSRKWMQMGLLMLAMIIVLVTSKRSATICIILIAALYIVHLTKTTKTSLRTYFLIALGIIISYLVISRYFYGSFLGIIERMSTMKETQGTGRIPIYHTVIDVLKTNDLIDWIFGRGIGSIRITGHTNAHNDALQILFEFGIVGLILYLAMLWKVFKRTLTLRRIKSSYYFGYLASLVIVVVLGLVSNLVVFYSYFSFICAYWGLAEYDITHKQLQSNTNED